MVVTRVSARCLIVRHKSPQFQCQLIFSVFDNPVSSLFCSVHIRAVLTITLTTDSYARVNLVLHYELLRCRPVVLIALVTWLPQYSFLIGWQLRIFNESTAFGSV